MKKTLLGLAAGVLVLAVVAAGQQPAKKLKVFISVDMEGISGLINWDETDNRGPDYPLFRKLMTEEANAAVAGALEAGATEIVVRDAHDSARNILPDLLRPEAQLIREWGGGPLDMMEGIDETFDAVVFVGYHARAGTPNAVLKHTMSLSVYDLVLNGVRLPEAAGDAAICKQAREILGNVETVAVKEGIGKAAKMIHPSKSQGMIRKGVEEALKNRASFKPYRPTPPYTLEIAFADENLAQRASWIPGAQRAGERAITFTASDLMEIIKYFALVRL